MVNLKETDLYQPIYDYFTTLGYKVNSEVHDCDITAVKDETLVMIELKKQLNIKLLIQGTKRQKLTDFVYLAIPRPKNLRSKEWLDKKYLIRRLELGLIFVSFSGKKPKVQIACHPESFDLKRSKNASKHRRDNILKEIEGRNRDYNIGGSRKRKLITAYRENSIHIACCLKKFEQLSPKELREIGTGDKTSDILQKNFYGWFLRVNRGIYTLTEEGKHALKEYKELADYYMEKISGFKF